LNHHSAILEVDLLIKLVHEDGYSNQLNKKLLPKILPELPIHPDLMQLHLAICTLSDSSEPNEAK